jgi:protocatechuate 3,4-dioxygenase beta subunit
MPEPVVGSVIEGNCVAVRRGGEQPEVNRQSVEPASAQALGERIIVHGQITDEDGRPIPHTIVEIWQANAAGRYQHPADQHDAPTDPNFRGEGRVFTDGEGWYRFTSIKPGAYPRLNHHNAWRPNHIHFSFFGSGFAQRLVTQMYFPGDPLLALDPILPSITERSGIGGNCAAEKRGPLVSVIVWSSGTSRSCGCRSPPSGRPCRSLRRLIRAAGSPPRSAAS